MGDEEWKGGVEQVSEEGGGVTGRDLKDVRPVRPEVH